MHTRPAFWRHCAAIGTMALLAACAPTGSGMVGSNPPPTPPGPDATWYHIEFGSSSFAIGVNGQRTVVDISTTLKRNPTVIATIIGKADSVGSPDYNMHLSRQRADAVRDALIYQNNVAADRVETRWTGETRQRVATAADVPLEANRVVDIAVH